MKGEAVSDAFSVVREPEEATPGAGALGSNLGGDSGRRRTPLGARYLPLFQVRRPKGLVLREAVTQ